ncbi:NADPH-dependent FMN reductase [Parafrankia sp. EUN1f]|uniref:NADPH-dependent FMN reductase n=1 Tax=Parafrankia sp. EUN1f TaxID=102897 RepID=UPI0001C44ADD|nr:NAD(P)H-dependent oxidoreductase [Parafrankia sp. EUN1f]EFC83406.1 NADPH-dependent FMN reductase [Parafrankia sp. EUN1f]
MSAPPGPRGTLAPRPSLVVLDGSPQLASRTLTVARFLAHRLATSLPARPPAAFGPEGTSAAEGLGPPGTSGTTGAGSGTVELARLAGDLFTDAHGPVRARLAEVRDAEVLVVATPAYKGQYTGLLKAFLDLLPPGALAGTLVVPVVVANAPEHRVTTDVALRAVLAELGAALPVRSFTLVEAALGEVEAHGERWLSAHLRVLRAVLTALAPPTAPLNGSRPAA